MAAQYWDLGHIAVLAPLTNKYPVLLEAFSGRFLHV